MGVSAAERDQVDLPASASASSSAAVSWLLIVGDHRSHARRGVARRGGGPARRQRQVRAGPRRGGSVHGESMRGARSVGAAGPSLVVAASRCCYDDEESAARDARDVHGIDVVVLLHRPAGGCVASPPPPCKQRPQFERNASLPSRRADDGCIETESHRDSSFFAHIYRCYMAD